MKQVQIAQGRQPGAIDQAGSAENPGSWHHNRKVPKQSTAGRREIWFWILLLGSWMMLNSPAWPNQLLGGLGTAAFLCFAFRSLGKLQGMGMDFADWKPAPARFWLVTAALGGAAGCVGLGLASLAHERIGVAENWRVFLLQVALGSVLEEILFRGYLMRLLLLAFRGMNSKWVASVMAVHLLRPGTGGMAVAVISAIGTVYGYIRVASGSTATARVAHAGYNVTLHIGMAL
jgi:membrane protease YdiL (CAAX protease family)